MDDVGFVLIKDFQVFGLFLLFGESLFLNVLAFVFGPSVPFFAFDGKELIIFEYFLMVLVRKSVNYFGLFFGSKQIIHPVVDVSLC